MDSTASLFARIAPLIPKFLPKPSPQEAKLIADLRSRIAALDPIPAFDTNNAEGIWRSFQQSVRNRCLHKDPRLFLRWRPIRVTMFADGATRFYNEYRALRSCSAWRKVWEPLTRENTVGTPTRFFLDFGTSGNLVHQAYHLFRFHQHTGRWPWEFEHVIEFGGGYGCMARLMHEAGFKGSYTIYDLPEFSALQTFYLTLCKKPVVNGNDATSNISANGSILTTSKLQQIEKFLKSPPKNTLFIGMWSLSESPFEIRQPFENLLRGADGIMMGLRNNFLGLDNVSYIRQLLNEQPKDPFQPVIGSNIDQYVMVANS